jgi:GNAT superfamily N-acetyltransferase
MRLSITNRCPEANGYRAARVKSLFNVESGSEFRLEAELPIDDREWSLGVIVGPGGSGKTSLGRKVLGGRAFYRPGRWPRDAPIIEAISPEGDFDQVTASLSAVGLGTVPAWLRPYHVLSNGERFRADLARILCERPSRVVIDEFTSVIDRQIARVGAMAFAKAWRRTAGRAVLLSCHRDIIDWVSPDWVYDTSCGRFHGRWLRRRPTIDLEIRQSDWSYWPMFEPHHYLKLGRMIASVCYIGSIAGDPVAHVGVGTCLSGSTVEARACRLVVMPEWQGAGVGMRFINEVARLQLEGRGRLPGRSLTTLLHTSHPGLAAALRRDPRWEQVSCRLYGDNRARSAASIARSASRGSRKPGFGRAVGYGGHFRAVQGFRYYGEAA